MKDQAESRAPRILLAEDDDELRQVLADRLRATGARVQECADGAQLLEAVEHIFSTRTDDEIDLLVTDVRMPGFTGLEVLEGLDVFGGRCPVIVITAFGDEETHAEARRLGAAAVFDKPFRASALLHEAQRLLERSRRMKDVWHGSD